jgi:hypothetical protein
MTAPRTHGLEGRLRTEIDGDVLFDTFSRGRYATDASHYQITPRGGGTSQSGQTINSWSAPKARSPTAPPSNSNLPPCSWSNSSNPMPKTPAAYNASPP